MATTVDAASVPQTSDGQRLEAWEQRTRPLIIAAALIPLVGVSTGTEHFGVLGVAVEIACWVVFVVDLVVHLRLHPGYLRTGVGKFDFGVVILTSPWYLLPGVHGGEFVTLLRLARLARVALIGIKAPVVKRTMERLGRPFAYVAIMLMISAAIVMRAENHQHGFKNYGDSVWWGIVTITTVGYGDIVPQTTLGRVMATVLMLTGVALLGTVAASLASMFRLEDKAVEDTAVEDTARAGVVAVPPGATARTAGPTGAGTAPEGPGPADPEATAVMTAVTTELRALRAEVAALREELGRRT